MTTSPAFPTRIIGECGTVAESLERIRWYLTECDQLTRFPDDVLTGEYLTNARDCASRLVASSNLIQKHIEDIMGSFALAYADPERAPKPKRRERDFDLVALPRRSVCAACHDRLRAGDDAYHERGGILDVCVFCYEDKGTD